MVAKKGGGGGGSERVEARTTLAAVLLADSFTQVSLGSSGPTAGRCQALRWEQSGWVRQAGVAQVGWCNSTRGEAGRA